MGRQIFRLLLFGIVAFFAVRACRDWQAKEAAKHEIVRDPESAATPSYVTDKTRRMEAEARAIAQRFEEIRNATDMSDAEKERALAEVLERQRKLAAEGEGR
jgi:hypothetical protein